MKQGRGRKRNNEVKETFNKKIKKKEANIDVVTRL